MAVRALIVAIEHYDRVTDGSLTTHLPGTLAAGLAFRNWLLKTKSDPQILFCSEPSETAIGGTGASLVDVKSALLKLRDGGKDSTEEFYFFFSGHGFSFEEDSERTDIIVMGDFANADLSNDCCVKVDGIVKWSRETLGTGRHVHFVDACRNVLRPNQAAVGNSQIMLRSPGSSGVASACVLQSTAPGETARVEGPFSTALIAGLGGAGRAKDWDDRFSDAMVVSFDSLTRQVQASVRGQTLSPSTSGITGSDCILSVLSPVPKTAFTVEIQGALPSPLAGTLLYRRARSTADEKVAVAATPTVLRFEPDTYKIALEVDGTTVVETIPIQVDLYNDLSQVFTLAPLETPAARKSMFPAFPIPDLSGLLAGFQSVAGSVSEVGGALMDSVTGGERSRRSQPVAPHKHDLALPPTAVEAGPPSPGSLAASSIASKLPTRSNGTPDFSESLGGVAFDPDLEVSLAVIGGGRILGVELAFYKLSRLPLHRLGEQEPGGSPIYVLAALASREAELRVGLSRDQHVAWQRAEPVADMDGLAEALLPARPGGQLLSLHVSGHVPLTVATFAAPDRATLVTLAPGSDGHLRIAQYLLPLGHRRASLPPEASDSHPFRELPLIHAAAQARRAFRDSRSVDDALGAETLRFFSSAAWLDPVTTCLIGYDHARQGRPGEIDAVAAALRRAYPELPDTAALTALGQEPVPLHGVPIVLDGVLASSGLSGLPLPSARLDLRSSWTLWRAAVEAPGDL